MTPGLAVSVRVGRMKCLALARACDAHQEAVAQVRRLHMGQVRARVPLGVLTPVLSCC